MFGIKSTRKIRNSSVKCRVWKASAENKKNKVTLEIEIKLITYYQNDKTMLNIDYSIVAIDIYLQLYRQFITAHLLLLSHWSVELVAANLSVNQFTVNWPLSAALIIASVSWFIISQLTFRTMTVIYSHDRLLFNIYSLSVDFGCL